MAVSQRAKLGAVGLGGKKVEDREGIVSIWLVEVMRMDFCQRKIVVDDAD